MDVVTAVLSRRSTRAFLPQPVPEATLRELLALARRAPSNNNLQPWKVHALTGAAREEVVARVRERIASGAWGEGSEVPPYPKALSELHRARRRKVGADLYARIGVAPEDKVAKLGHVARNFEFFGAPVGLIFSIGREMEKGQWADLGMFAQTLMLLARERGLATCAQQAWAEWHATLRALLGIPADEVVAFGMSLGYPDESAPINALATERAALDEFAVLRGW